MAKAKVLADRISITSEILTDENIRKAEILSPSSLVLFDEKDESKMLYRVCEDSCNSFTTYGASFKDGKSLGTISEKIMDLDKEAKEKELRKQQWQHDFRVALFSAVIGGFTGFLATVITQMLL